MWKTQRIRGEWSREKIEKCKKELSSCEIDPEVIVIGGPTNSLTRHGQQNRRGFGPEGKVEIGRGQEGEEVMRFKYHLTEPVKITLGERVRLIGMVDKLV